MKIFCALILSALCAAAGCSSTPGAVTGDGSVGASGGGSGAAGSGAGGAAGTTAAMNCAGSGGPVDPTALIDDMEATDPAILMEAGRNGTWWAGGDAVSANASIVPDGDAMSELIPGGGRCGSLHAMHVTGQGFTSWALMSVSMRYGAVDGGAAGLLPYDAHIRTGLTFWARIGDTSAAQVRLGVSDKYSRPEGGLCDGSSAATTATACYDLFGVDLKPISTTWTQYRIPFAGLGQRNFGLPRPSLDTSSLYTIEFGFYPNTTFSFWIDDLSFY